VSGRCPLRLTRSGSNDHLECWKGNNLVAVPDGQQTIRFFQNEAIRPTCRSAARRLVKVMKVGSSDFKHLVDIRGAAAGWVGESGTRSETATFQLREISPTMGELYAYPQTTEWALDDMFFDVSA
jgi:predicted phage gp36 major capsid-like protein